MDCTGYILSVKNGKYGSLEKRRRAYIGPAPAQEADVLFPVDGDSAIIFVWIS